MDINDKKLKRTSKFINWIVSIVLGIFLIQLSNLVIYDLDSTINRPSFSAFQDNEALRGFAERESALQKQINAQYETLSNYRQIQSVAIADKDAEQESFENWIKTRTSTGDPSQDKEVLSRSRKIDEYRSVSQSWSNKCDSVQSIINNMQSQMDEISQQERTINRKADKLYESAMNRYDIWVFFIRLLFVAPVLALGIFFFVKYRKHKFAALFMGFTIFSVYAFFVGLVPYLPSYGGYIRYIVGILLTGGLGYYAIKKIRVYSENKKSELKESTTERAKKLQNEITEKAFNNHVCPSCGKDFLIKPWEANSVNVNRNSLQPTTNYCRYCGLQIMKKCHNCEQPNFAHLPFCTSCGVNIKQE